MGWTAGRSAFSRSAAGWPRPSLSWRTARPASCGMVDDGNGTFDAWIATKRPPTSWRERADIDWWASWLARRHEPELRALQSERPGKEQRSGDDAFYRRLADLHLEMMAYQLGYPPDAEIGGCHRPDLSRRPGSAHRLGAPGARPRGSGDTAIRALPGRRACFSPRRRSRCHRSGRRRVHARPGERGLSCRRARCRGRSTRSARPEPARLVDLRADDRAAALPDPRAQTTRRAGVSQLRLSPRARLPPGSLCALPGQAVRHQCRQDRAAA